MAEYIEREASCKDCIHYCVCKDTVADENWGENASKEIKEMFSPKGCENYTPAADVVEVRHGEWVCVNESDNVWMCDGKDGCGGEIILLEGTPYDNEWDYCPNCGAKMDGKGEGE